MPKDQRSPSEASVRVEDAALLTGRGRYFDDLPAPGGVLHAAVVRSLHAHARVQSIDIAAASALPGVRRVITGADYAALAAPLMVGLKLPIDCWPIAQDKTRYVGEPVAVVLADDRYIAEDAADLIEVDYDRLAPVIDPEGALVEDAPVLHDGMGHNLGADRHFR